MKNREMRIKYAEEPQKFMESEVELNTAIQVSCLIVVVSLLITLLCCVSLLCCGILIDCYYTIIPKILFGLSINERWRWIEEIEGQGSFVR